MKNFTKSTTLFMGFIMLSLFAKSQSQLKPDVFASAGDVEETSELLISYTFGEPITTTISSNSWLLTQGFQQPYFLSTSLSETTDLITQTFPNPTYGLVEIKLSERIQPDAEIQLFNSLGKMVKPTVVSVSEKTIRLDMLSLSTGMYFLRLDNKGERIGSIKIIKQ